jgi:hypothetical protein
VSGGRVLWTYPINQCPEELALSEDGTIAYLLTPRTDGDTQRLIVLRDGRLLGEQPLKPSTEGLSTALRSLAAEGRPVAEIRMPALYADWEAPSLFAANIKVVADRMREIST